MSDIPALVFSWDGEVMRPRLPKLADKHYVIGERYILVPYENRSEASHRHFFASVKSAWENLPEDLAVRFPTPDHLRKFALIKAGYANSHTFTCASRAEARRLAAFLQPVDEFAVIDTAGTTVTRWTARSQSQKAMGKDIFQKSKDAVLDVLAGMIAVPVKTLTDNAGGAA